MSGDIRSAFITLALSLPAIVLCLSVHETAHGGAAYLLGDRTARDSGRVTLSPMAHIDPIGFLCLLLFGFGWARPVPVNIANFRNRRWGMALTALAGPVSNFITAFIAYCLYFVVRMNMANTFLWSLSQFLLIVASMSVGLGVFNLVPVHPLDGSRVVEVPEYHLFRVYRGALVRLAGRHYGLGRQRRSHAGGKLRQPVSVSYGFSFRQL